MTEIELIELARAYVALSNAHQLDLIGAMFDEKSRYQSSSLGEFRGAAAIEEMMAGFFARYPDVYWQAHNFQIQDDCVSFEFSMSASEQGSGETLEREGSEKISFDTNGIITRLEVDAG